jgi:hypothetical protein
MRLSPRYRASVPGCLATLFFLYFLSFGIALAQSDSKNRKDEKKENQRVEQTRREWSQSQTELRKLQVEWEDKYQSVLSARRDYLQAKRNLELAREWTEEQLGEKLGIREQMEVTRKAGEAFLIQSQTILDRVRASSDWRNKSERIEAIDKALKLGIDPSTNLPMSSDDLESIERELATEKRLLQKIEDAAIALDPKTLASKEKWQAAQNKLEAIRQKLDPDEVDSSPECYRAKSELEQASKEVQSASLDLNRASVAVQKKARELGSDYTAFLKARRADQSDRNRPKPPPAKKK